MARFDPMGYEVTAQAQYPVISGEAFFQLGIAYATGRDGVSDLVSAHKWFNLAAMKGNRDALRYRYEIAQEMTTGQIAQAQRAAREWLSTH